MSNTASFEKPWQDRIPGQLYTDKTCFAARTIGIKCLFSFKLDTKKIMIYGNTGRIETASQVATICCMFDITDSKIARHNWKFHCFIHVTDVCIVVVFFFALASVYVVGTASWRIHRRLWGKL